MTDEVAANEANMAEELGFNFYLKFARPFVLNLPDPNDRALAAAWVKKLRDESSGDETSRMEYLKLLLFVMHRRRLMGPFLQNPSGLGTLEEISAESKVLDIARSIIMKDEEDWQAHMKEGAGDYPPYSIEYSADKTEYAAAQDIPRFGVHGYYATSTEPISQWYIPGQEWTKTSSSPLLKKAQDETPAPATPHKSPFKAHPAEPTATPKPKAKRNPIVQTFGVVPKPDERPAGLTWGSNLIEVTETKASPSKSTVHSTDFPPTSPGYGDHSMGRGGFTPPPRSPFMDHSMARDGFTPPPRPTDHSMGRDGFTPSPRPTDHSMGRDGFTPSPRPPDHSMGRSGYTPPPRSMSPLLDHSAKWSPKTPPPRAEPVHDESPIQGRSIAGQNILDIANASISEMDVDIENFENQFSGRHPGVPTTPPMFSRDPRVRELAGKTVIYTPEQFSVPAGEPWRSGESPIHSPPTGAMPSRTPFKAKPIRQLFPNIKGQMADSMLSDEAPDLVDDIDDDDPNAIEPVNVPAEDLNARLRRLIREIEGTGEATPASAGVASTTPHTHSPSPVRLNEYGTDYPLFMENMPAYESPEASPTAKAAEQYRELMQEFPGQNVITESPAHDPNQDQFGLPILTKPKTPPREPSPQRARTPQKSPHHLVPLPIGQTASEVEAIANAQYEELYNTMIEPQVSPAKSPTPGRLPSPTAPKSPTRQRSPSPSAPKAPTRERSPSPTAQNVRIKGWDSPGRAHTPRRTPQPESPIRVDMANALDAIGFISPPKDLFDALDSPPSPPKTFRYEEYADPFERPEDAYYDLDDEDIGTIVEAHEAVEYNKDMHRATVVVGGKRVAYGRSGRPRGIAPVEENLYEELPELVEFSPYRSPARTPTKSPSPTTRTSPVAGPSRSPTARTSPVAGPSRSPSARTSPVPGPSTRSPTAPVPTGAQLTTEQEYFAENFTPHNAQQEGMLNRVLNLVDNFQEGQEMLPTREQMESDALEQIPELPADIDLATASPPPDMAAIERHEMEMERLSPYVQSPRSPPLEIPISDFQAPIHHFLPEHRKYEYNIKPLSPQYDVIPLPAAQQRVVPAPFDPNKELRDELDVTPPYFVEEPVTPPPTPRLTRAPSPGSPGTPPHWPDFLLQGRELHPHPIVYDHGTDYMAMGSTHPDDDTTGFLRMPRRPVRHGKPGLMTLKERSPSRFDDDQGSFLFDVERATTKFPQGAFMSPWRVHQKPAQNFRRHQRRVQRRRGRLPLTAFNEEEEIEYVSPVAATGATKAIKKRTMRKRINFDSEDPSGIPEPPKLYPPPTSPLPIIPDRPLPTGTPPPPRRRKKLFFEIGGTPPDDDDAQQYEHVVLPEDLMGVAAPVRMNRRTTMLDRSFENEGLQEPMPLPVRVPGWASPTDPRGPRARTPPSPQRFFNTYGFQDMAEEQMPEEMYGIKIAQAASPLYSPLGTERTPMFFATPPTPPRLTPEVSPYQYPESTSPKQFGPSQVGFGAARSPLMTTTTTTTYSKSPMGEETASRTIITENVPEEIVQQRQQLENRADLQYAMLTHRTPEPMTPRTPAGVTPKPSPFYSPMTPPRRLAGPVLIADVPQDVQLQRTAVDRAAEDQYKLLYQRTPPPMTPRTPAFVTPRPSPYYSPRTPPAQVTPRMKVPTPPPRVRREPTVWERQKNARARLISDEMVSFEFMPPDTPPSPTELMEYQMETIASAAGAVPEERQPVHLYGYGEKRRKRLLRHSTAPIAGAIEEVEEPEEPRAATPPRSRTPTPPRAPTMMERIEAEIAEVVQSGEVIVSPRPPPSPVQQFELTSPKYSPRLPAVHAQDILDQEDEHVLMASPTSPQRRTPSPRAPTPQRSPRTPQIFTAGALEEGPDIDEEELPDMQSPELVASPPPPSADDVAAEADALNLLMQLQAHELYEDHFERTPRMNVRSGNRRVQLQPHTPTLPKLYEFHEPPESPRRPPPVYVNVGRLVDWSPEPPPAAIEQAAMDVEAAANAQYAALASPEEGPAPETYGVADMFDGFDGFDGYDDQGNLNLMDAPRPAAEIMALPLPITEDNFAWRSPTKSPRRSPTRSPRMSPTRSPRMTPTRSPRISPRMSPSPRYDTQVVPVAQRDYGDLVGYMGIDVQMPPMEYESPPHLSPSPRQDMVYASPIEKQVMYATPPQLFDEAVGGYDGLDTVSPMLDYLQSPQFSPRSPISAGRDQERMLVVSPSSADMYKNLRIIDYQEDIPIGTPVRARSPAPRRIAFNDTVLTSPRPPSPRTPSPRRPSPRQQPSPRRQPSPQQQSIPRSPYRTPIQERIRMQSPPSVGTRPMTPPSVGRVPVYGITPTGPAPPLYRTPETMITPGGRHTPIRRRRTPTPRVVTPQYQVTSPYQQQQPAMVTPPRYIPMDYDEFATPESYYTPVMNAQYGSAGRAMFDFEDYDDYDPIYERTDLIEYDIGGAFGGDYASRIRDTSPIPADALYDDDDYQWMN